MNILIIGSGGREHALAWKIAQSPQVTHVFVAPGNAGTALEPHVSNIAIESTNITALCEFARDHSIDLTIVGPEAPLSMGITDVFAQAGLACFGPSQAAAQLETSKSFSKDFMVRHHIPTAKYASFTAAESAKHYVKQQTLPLVIKADGLAAGKGVVIAHTEAEVMTAIDTMLTHHHLGMAGNRIVIEEFLTGEEASFIVMVDGKHILPLATSQDHKTRDDGDTGPNTGGMGAYSPAPVITAALHERILHEIIWPTVQGMTQDGIPYVGFLYAGLMITPEGNPKVLEYNCRLGDPETQVILLRLQSDLVTLCQAALAQNLAEIKTEWDPRPALGVVLAARGYPDQYAKDQVIHGLATVNSPQQKTFHAGTCLSNDNQVVTAGGRVLCVAALGNSVHDAQKAAYQAVKSIDWEDKYYRSDIGHRAIAREKKT